MTRRSVPLVSAPQVFPGPAPARSQPGRPPRQDYTLTEAEWLALGGTELDPADVDANGTLRRNARVPSEGEVLAIWKQVATRLDLAVLSIHWPDPHSPDFTARPR